MLTKNEADVIAYCLQEASKWADFIYIYDNESTDGTWEIVQALKSERIIPWKQHNKIYSDGIRADVFNEFRRFAQEGDWWLKLDADDFYLPEFKQQLDHVPAGHDMVWTVTLDFHITNKDLAGVDFEAPIAEVLANLKYYKAGYSEPHCFRHRQRLSWTSATSWPKHAGVAARIRPLLKHYPHRTPKQIQMRLDLRRAVRAKGFNGWDHASQVTWQEKIVDHSECLVDDGSGHYSFDESKLPQHIEPLPRRLCKMLMHRTGIWP
ncbi:MAG: glycosyltransferase family 2 protein [Opitutaceae bacterium]|nr:glycosyltransferase family 2 protein [Verrucomicrobiales bacterium]